MRWGDAYRMKTVSTLARIEAQLEQMANVLEAAGFEEQAQALDAAACYVEDVKDEFTAVL